MDGALDLNAVPEEKLAELTAKQRECFELKRAGKTREEIAAAQGCSKSVISSRLQRIYAMLGFSAKGGESIAGRTNAVENRDPEAAAAMIDAASDPLLRVKEALLASGLPDRVSEAMLKRLRAKFFGAVHEVKALKTNELIQMCEEKLGMIGFYLDDKVMAEASARDLGLMAGVLIEKRQLLRGEPTQIVSDAERKKLHELLPLAIAEAQRRGLTLQGQVTEKHVEPA